MLKILTELQIKCKNSCKPAPPPTLAQIKEFETDFNFVLPQAYVEYAMHFGPGELAGDYKMFVPGYSTEPKLSLAGWNNFRHEGDDIIIEQYQEDEKMVKRLVYFCSTYERDHIAWDPADVTDKKTHEYGIYGLAYYSNKIVKLASTFDDFITQLFGNLTDKLGYSKMLSPPDKTFEHWT